MNILEKYNTYLNPQLVYNIHIYYDLYLSFVSENKSILHKDYIPCKNLLYKTNLYQIKSKFGIHSSPFSENQNLVKEIIIHYKNFFNIDWEVKPCYNTLIIYLPNEKVYLSSQICNSKTTNWKLLETYDAFRKI